MLLIRNLIYWLLLVLITPPIFLLFLPAALFHNGANKMGRVWALTLMWSLKHIIGLNYRVIGRENIPAGPAIICSKSRASADCKSNWFRQKTGVKPSPSSTLAKST